MVLMKVTWMRYGVLESRDEHILVPSRQELDDTSTHEPINNHTTLTTKFIRSVYVFLLQLVLASMCFRFVEPFVCYYLANISVDMFKFHVNIVRGGISPAADPEVQDYPLSPSDGCLEEMGELVRQNAVARPVPIIPE